MMLTEKALTRMFQTGRMSGIKRIHKMNEIANKVKEGKLTDEEGATKILNLK
jgi:hypothetical protein